MKEEAVRKSQQLAQGILDAMNVNVCTLDEHGYILSVNQSWLNFAQSNGGKIEAVNPGVNYLEVCDKVEGKERKMAESFAAGIRELIRGERDDFSMEYPCDTPEKRRWFLAEATSFVDIPLGSLIIVITHLDITERKQAEEYRAMNLEILRILNEPCELQDIIQRVLSELKRCTGFDAVGIRLKDGEDFPYVAQEGFSDDFILKENTLIRRNSDRGICRVNDGNVSLECACGLVISERINPANLLFTRGGSAWTNDSSLFLDIPTDQDPRLYPRNECIHQGYASVAQIPIRNNDAIVGLIQFNDRRKAHFTLETIELLEGIAAHIGEALMRKQAEAKLKKIEWMLSPKQTSDKVCQAENHDQGYGDLTELNSDSIILKSIGPELLRSLSNDYLEPLGTSSTIFEVNGNCTYAIFSSGWCRMMEKASRNLCDTSDNVEVRNSCRWLCYESCWTGCYKEAITRRAEVDIECNGGIRIHAVPIFSGENIVGAISLGYGDPPKDPEKLKMLADSYQLEYDDLLREANAYDSRPPYIIEMAKRRLSTTAKLIGSIIESKQAMAVLRESEEKHRRLFETMAQGVVYFAADGTIISANPAAERILGLSLEPMRGRLTMDPRWRMIKEDGTEVPGMDYPAMISLRTGETFGPVIRGVFHSHKNAYIWLSITAIPLFLPGGTKPSQAYVTFADITERKRAQQQTEIRVKLIDYASEHSLNEVMTRALDEIEHFLNSAISFLHFVERDQKTLSLQQWSTATVERFCTAPGQGLHYDIGRAGVWADCIRERRGVIHNDYASLPRKKGLPDGHAALVREMVVPVMRQNAVVAIMGVGNKPVEYTNEDLESLSFWADVTWEVIKRKMSKEALLQSNKEFETATMLANDLAAKAETANRAKSIFLANMSHEIRTPLTAMLGFAQILERDPSLTPRQIGMLHTIGRSGRHLLDLINDLLDMAKLESDRLELSPQDFNLYQLLDDLEMMFRSSALAKHLWLTVERDDSVPRYVNADERKLRQVLINLMGNAVKFTKTGGVAIRVKCESVAGTTPNNPHRARLICEVEESGPGIAEDELGRIFEPFWQSAANQEAGGTGLGLAVSRRLVELMDGNLTVKSQMGKGSCFRFDVLVTLAEGAAQEEEQGARQAIGLEPGTGPIRILIVDDQQDNRDMLIALLEPLGFDIREAANGQEALDVFEAWSPHAVLMDMQMPVLDGYEAIRRIKATQIGRTTPVVAVTASAFDDAEKQILAMGVDGYVRKPFRSEEIFTVLRKSLGLRYVYAESTRQAPVKVSVQPLTREDLAALPEALQQAMRQAVDEGDMAWLQTLIDQIEKTDPEAARKLRNLGDLYDYETLSQVLAKQEEGESNE